MTIGIRNVLVRRCLAVQDFEPAIDFYEKLFDQPVRLRFDYEAAGLKLAQVASLLFLGGEPEKLAAFRATEATFLVRDIDAAKARIVALGGRILRPVQIVPTGRNLLMQHRDGMVVEYVQHNDPNPADDVLLA